MTGLGRRDLLKAACMGCAAVGLAACGGGSSGGGSGSGSGAGGATPSAGGRAANTALAKLADIPVGGSKAVKGPDGQSLVLARPNATTVVCFSAICTHQGCTVEPAGKQYACPCHGSIYDAFTGKNLSGPAPSPLHPFAVKVSGADVVAA